MISANQSNKNLNVIIFLSQILNKFMKSKTYKNLKRERKIFLTCSGSKISLHLPFSSKSSQKSQKLKKLLKIMILITESETLKIFYLQKRRNNKRFNPHQNIEFIPLSKDKIFWGLKSFQANLDLHQLLLLKEAKL